MYQPTPEEKRVVSELHTTLRHEGGSWFTARLFELILKADPRNLERIRKGFPVEVRMVEEWRSSESEQAFFEKYLVSSIS